MKRTATAVTGVALLALGCASRQMPAASSGPPPFEDPGDSLRIGVARAAITPPPGAATFGHGPDARVTSGLWTRLYCRAFVLVSHQEPLVIVPCDLPAIGTLLQRSVVEEVNRQGLALHASRLMLSATHTHAGPAHYFDGQAYTGPGSTELPGFDPEMVSFLARSIGNAIVRAYASAEPGSLRWVHTRALGLSHNRNLLAFKRNRPTPVADGCQALPDDACAIDPQLDILELRVAHQTSVVGADAVSCTLGSLSFFAMHPTVLPNTNRLLGADAFGVASRYVEGRYRQQLPAGCPTDPLAGIVNANEGDAVPRWKTGSIEEAIDIGTELGERIGAAADTVGEFDHEPKLAARYVEIDMRANRFGLGAASATRDTETCARAELGALAALGANDHPTFLYRALGHGPRPDPRRRGCQAPKAAFPRLLGGLTSGDAAFTSIVPLSVARIGDAAIAFVPAELTTAAGLEVKAAMAKAFDAAKDPVVPIIGGLTNGYIQYVTTPEEYAAQGYEGASNLFGPGSGPLFARVARALSQNLLDRRAPLPDEPDVAHAFEYSLGPERERLPRGKGQTPLSEIAVQRRALDFCTAKRGQPLALCFVWSDGAPGIARINEQRWVGLATATGPRPTVLLDDRGTAFRTIVHGAAHDLWIWSTMVQPTPAEWATIAGDRSLRVVTNLDDAATPESPRFTVADPPRDCTKAELQFCRTE